MSGLARGGLRYSLPLAVAGVAAAPFSLPATAGLLVIAAAVVAFHRDPDRTTPESGIVAPADGTVSVLRTEEETGQLRLGIFMNLHHVHVNRAPLGGTVESVEHSPGAHRPAFTKSSDRNEKLTISFPDYEVVLIAGAFARRIHPYVESGSVVERGERIGHISFGSRVDVVFPADVDRDDLSVEEGDPVRAGETKLASR